MGSGCSSPKDNSTTSKKDAEGRSQHGAAPGSPFGLGNEQTVLVLLRGSVDIGGEPIDPDWRLTAEVGAGPTAPAAPTTFVEDDLTKSATLSGSEGSGLASTLSARALRRFGSIGVARVMAGPEVAIVRSNRSYQAFTKVWAEGVPPEMERTPREAASSTIRVGVPVGAEAPLSERLALRGGVTGGVRIATSRDRDRGPSLELGDQIEQDIGRDLEIAPRTVDIATEHRVATGLSWHAANGIGIDLEAQGGLTVPLSPFLWISWAPEASAP